MKSIFIKVVSIYKRKGLVGLLKKIKGFLSERVYLRKFIWHEIDISLPIITASLKKPIRISFCIDSKYEVIEWRKYRFYDSDPYPDEIIMNKIAIENNHIFPCIKINNVIVGFMMVGFNKVYIKNFGKILELHEGNTFIYESYVVPEYRNIGLSTLMRTNLLRFIKDKGFNKVYCHIRSGNIPSLRVSEKCGAKKIGSTRQFRFFRFTIFGKLPSEVFKI